MKTVYLHPKLIGGAIYLAPLLPPAHVIPIIPAVLGVSVAPGTVIANGALTQKFTASAVAIGGADPSVRWTTTNGTISLAGLLTYPVPSSFDQNGTVTATSNFDGTKSGSASFTVPALPLPLAPSNVSALAAAGAVIVSAKAPLVNGSMPVVSYTATASTGQTATGATLPVVVPMPALTSAYFTVHANTTDGAAGAESERSAVVTPLPVTGSGKLYAVSPASRDRTIRL